MGTSKQIGIYVDSESARYHFDHLPTLRFNHAHYRRDLRQYLLEPLAVRIAVFHVPFPFDSTWLDRFETAYLVCDRVLVLCSELHESIMQQLHTIDRPRVSIYLCGVVNVPFEQATVNFWLDWFHTSSEFYARAHPGFLDTKLAPYAAKPLLFDILLGNRRPHRDFIYNWVRENQPDINIMTYHKFSHIDLLNNSEFIQETTGVEYYPEQLYTHSVDSIRYHGREMTLSQVVPIDIYNQTAYSIVAETNWFNEFNFYTEKIVKPMLARRLFIVFAGKNYLANLRSLGFRTFDGIIDEGYDNEADHTTRWRMAADQMRALANKPQEIVLDMIKPIAEHNHRLITDVNWYSLFTTALENELLVLVNEAKVGPSSFA